MASASAKTIRGTAKAEVLRGTASADKIYGGAGNDKLYGLGGNDYFYPGAGIDVIYCGAGIDHVLADVKDKVAKDCEIVIRPKIEIPPSQRRDRAPDPVPLGKEVALGDGWRLKVESVTPDATPQVLDANDSNDPPIGRLAVLHRPGDRHLCLARLGQVRGRVPSPHGRRRCRLVLGIREQLWRGSRRALGSGALHRRHDHGERLLGYPLVRCCLPRALRRSVQTVPKRIFLSLH